MERSESGQEGSKESRFGRLLPQQKRTETPSAIFQTVSPRTSVNKLQSLRPTSPGGIMDVVAQPLSSKNATW